MFSLLMYFMLGFRLRPLCTTTPEDSEKKKPYYYCVQLRLPCANLLVHSGSSLQYFHIGSLSVTHHGLVKELWRSYFLKLRYIKYELKETVTVLSTIVVVTIACILKLFVLTGPRVLGIFRRCPVYTP